jgi:hypothetical protein
MPLKAAVAEIIFTLNNHRHIMPGEEFSTVDGDLKLHKLQPGPQERLRLKAGRVGFNAVNSMLRLRIQMGLSAAFKDQLSCLNVGAFGV